MRFRFGPISFKCHGYWTTGQLSLMQVYVNDLDSHIKYSGMKKARTSELVLVQSSEVMRIKSGISVKNDELNVKSWLSLHYFYSRKVILFRRFVQSTGLQQNICEQIFFLNVMIATIALYSLVSVSWTLTFFKSIRNCWSDFLTNLTGVW